MKKDELLAVGVAQYTRGGQPLRAKQFMERVNETLSDFGEGFAVFVGSSLHAFTGDVGSARHIAREAVNYAKKREDVRIKRVRVPDTKI